MTYRQLKKRLQEMDKSKLDNDVTLYDKDSDEYFPALSVDLTDETFDTLDDDSRIIITF